MPVAAASRRLHADRPAQPQAYEPLSPSPADCFHGEDASCVSIAAQLIPPAPARWRKQSRPSSGGRATGGATGGFDPSLAAALDRSRKKIALPAFEDGAQDRPETMARDARGSAMPLICPA